MKDRKLLCLLLCLWGAGCANRLADAQVVAGASGLQQAEIQTDIFRITSFSRHSEGVAPTVVYIEGDGFAWVTASQPSSDPTPKHALGLRLASLDPAPNVVYLARPCQFTPQDKACRVDYWTSKRFSEEVIASLNEAINQSAGKQGIHLVGYSGGGAIAALIAARRDDVLSLRTVAGNLDPTELNLYHHVSPLTGSLDPMKVAARLSRLPQRHWVGDKDEVVPPFIAENFIKAQKQPSCAILQHAPQATHEQGWEDVWVLEVRGLVPTCVGE